MTFKPQYYVYEDLCKNGYQTIRTEDINSNTIDSYFYGLINILKDGIETEEVQRMMVHVIFTDNEEIDLSIFDLIYNLMMWYLCTGIGEQIKSIYIVFFEDITKRRIKDYIDNIFVDQYRKNIDFMSINHIIDNVIGKFRDLKPFQMYLCNTLNFKDTIDLMNQYPEFNETIHFDISNIPLEEVKDKGMEAANKQIKYIKNSNHCLRDAFRTGEGISPKQYKEVAVNIGTKPDGQGSVFPHPIAHSFMNGGLQTPEELCIESSVGRIAQILQKTNVGESGAFARNLELNNQDTFLHPDPNYICDTQNFEEVTITNETKLDMFNLRYYRENPRGVDKLCESKKCKHLIGRKLYFRSPMTCVSAARGLGICYKCYGDLAYANKEINIGQVAAEGLSSIYTQILLSAKHLLESLVVKLQWTEEFYELFDINFNTIGLKPNGIYRNIKLIIDQEIFEEEELDDIVYNYYINSFIVKDSNGNEHRIRTSESDNIYFVPEFYNYVSKYRSNVNDDERIELDMVDILNKDFAALFIMEIKNNELSRTMDKIKKIIDNKSEIEKYDKNSILEAFIDTNISGNIKLNSVHFEVLLMNQIRSADDELELPDFTVPNQKYQILTLSKALSNNRSITVRLQSNKVQKVLQNPQNMRITKPAMTDLFFMEQPQQYLTDDIISDEYQPENDKESNTKEPVSFKDSSIKVRRGK